MTTRAEDLLNQILASEWFTEYVTGLALAAACSAAEIRQIPGDRWMVVIASHCVAILDGGRHPHLRVMSVPLALN